MALNLEKAAFANSILTDSFELKGKITHLKLQKLAYFCYGYFLAAKDEEIVRNFTFEAWPYGPVNTDFYHEFKRFKHNPITELAETDEKKGLHQLLAASDEGRIIRQVIGELVYYDDFALANKTHRQGGAWVQTFKQGEGRGQLIAAELIKEEFKKNPFELTLNLAKN